MTPTSMLAARDLRTRARLRTTTVSLIVPVLFLIGLGLSSSRVAAAKKQSADTAREHTRRATAAYNLGHFDEAVEEFEEAYKLVQDPALLFNIAQACRLAGRPEKALNGYKSYLRTAPRGAKDREAAQKWRDELERTQAQSKTAPAAEPSRNLPAPFDATVVPAKPDKSTEKSTEKSAERSAETFAAPDAGVPGKGAAVPEPASGSPGVNRVERIDVVRPEGNADAGGPARGHPIEGPARESPGGGTFADGLPALLDIEADARLLKRDFDFPTAMGAQAYRLNFVPTLGGRVNLYPGARAAGWIAHVGLLAQGEIATWLRSAGYPTGTSEIVVGPQFRIPGAFGQIGGSAAFFRHALIVGDTAQTDDAARVTLAFPNTAYVGGRLGLNARFRSGSRVTIGLDGGYRFVATPGAGTGLVRSKEYFPNAQIAYALDGGVLLGFRLLQELEARIGIDYRVYRFETLQGTNFQGTGATDQYLALSLGLVGIFGQR